MAVSPRQIWQRDASLWSIGSRTISTSAELLMVALIRRLRRVLTAPKHSVLGGTAMFQDGSPDWNRRKRRFVSCTDSKSRSSIVHAVYLDLCMVYQRTAKRHESRSATIICLFHAQGW